MSVAAAGTRGDAPSSYQLLYNHTWCHPHLYISTFLGSVFVRSMFRHLHSVHVHHLLETHLGFVVAWGYRLQVLRPLLHSACGWDLDQVVCGMYEAVSGFKALSPFMKWTM